MKNWSHSKQCLYGRNGPNGTKMVPCIVTSPVLYGYTHHNNKPSLRVGTLAMMWCLVNWLEGETGYHCISVYFYIYVRMLDSSIANLIKSTKLQTLGGNIGIFGLKTPLHAYVLGDHTSKNEL